MYITKLSDYLGQYTTSTSQYVYSLFGVRKSTAGSSNSFLPATNVERMHQFNFFSSKTYSYKYRHSDSRIRQSVDVHVNSQGLCDPRLFLLNCPCVNFSAQVSEAYSGVLKNHLVYINPQYYCVIKTTPFHYCSTCSD